ncbi:MAG: molybdate ABC transporter permease subunit [Chloroflexi bacterium]|nr:molybdate ABC transporter permease subunit [Chloroflexota bacterium]
MKKLSDSKWIFILPSVFIIGLFLLPLLAVFLRSINPDFFYYAFSQKALSALKLSIVTSTVTTICTIILGTPLAYILASWNLKFKSWVELLIDLPIVLPPSVAGLALLITFGRRGLLGSTLSILGISLPFTTAAVVIAQMFVAAPLYIRSARIGFKGVDKQLEEAANVEGANRWQLFREVLLPLTSRALLNGAILTWTRALGEFGATILFAGNLEGVTQTMPMAIYLGFETDRGVALALSVVLIVVSTILLGITRKIEKDNEHS